MALTYSDKHPTAGARVPLQPDARPFVTRLTDAGGMTNGSYFSLAVWTTFSRATANRKGKFPSVAVALMDGGRIQPDSGLWASRAHTFRQ